jgi:hypothetical protein
MPLLEALYTQDVGFYMQCDSGKESSKRLNLGDGGGIDKMVSFEFAYDNPEFSDRVLQLEVTPKPLFCKCFSIGISSK